MFYFLLWSAVITYGNLNSLRQSSTKNYQEENDWLDGYPAESRTDLDLSGSQIASALDDLFSPATVTKQFVINILGVSHSLSYTCLYAVIKIPLSSWNAAIFMCICIIVCEVKYPQTTRINVEMAIEIFEDKINFSFFQATGGTLFLILVSLFPETFSIRKRRETIEGMIFSSKIEHFSEK